MCQEKTFRRRRPAPPRRPVKTRLEVEVLESRCVLSNLSLTPLVQVSGPSPFADCVTDQFTHGEAEPLLAVNPTNPKHMVAVWAQDHVRGDVAAVSFNGGKSWQSVVIPRLSVCFGGIYERATDPWISFAPNGDLYFSGIAFDVLSGKDSAVLVSKSTDGGLTWGAPATIVTGKTTFNGPDKDSITADPTDAKLVYVTWVQFQGNNSRTMFSRTTDGGQTWEPARKIFDSGSNNDDIGHQIVVLPNGDLVNFFTQLIVNNFGDGNGDVTVDSYVSLIRSTDKGQTWLPENKTPIRIAQIVPVTEPFFTGRVRNPDGGPNIVPGFPDYAVDPASGNLYAVWRDARFSKGQHFSIAFSMSSDGGFTWSTPIQVNQTPNNIDVLNREAFVPSVAVAADGTVAVTYYDFRYNTSDPGLLTDYWMVHAHANTDLTNPASWTSENRLTVASFDMSQDVGRPGFFMGDYAGLAAAGNSFAALWAMPHTNPDGTIDQASIFFRDPLPAGETATADSHLAVAAPNSSLTTAPYTASELRALDLGTLDWLLPPHGRAERGSTSAEQEKPVTPLSLNVASVVRFFAAPDDDDQPLTWFSPEAKEDALEGMDDWLGFDWELPL